MAWCHYPCFHTVRAGPNSEIQLASKADACRFMPAILSRYRQNVYAITAGCCLPNRRLCRCSALFNNPTLVADIEVDTLSIHSLFPFSAIDSCFPFIFVLPRIFSFQTCQSLPRSRISASWRHRLPLSGDYHARQHSWSKELILSSPLAIFLDMCTRSWAETASTSRWTMQIHKHQRARHVPCMATCRTIGRQSSTTNIKTARLRKSTKLVVV